MTFWHSYSELTDPSDQSRHCHQTPELHHDWAGDPGPGRAWPRGLTSDHTPDDAPSWESCGTRGRAIKRGRRGKNYLNLFTSDLIASWDWNLGNSFEKIDCKEHFLVVRIPFAGAGGPSWVRGWACQGRCGRFYWKTWQCPTNFFPCVLF